MIMETAFVDEINLEKDCIKSLTEDTACLSGSLFSSNTFKTLGLLS